MKETDLTKIRFCYWIENLTDEEVAHLISDAQSCLELDRCFVYCLDSDCEFFSLLLLARTPTPDFRRTVIDWVSSISEEQLRDLLEKGIICGEQSFCMNYCGSERCLFRRLIRDLCAISEFVT
jgi:hypothetical protein